MGVDQRSSIVFFWVFTWTAARIRNSDVPHGPAMLLCSCTAAKGRGAPPIGAVH